MGNLTKKATSVALSVTTAVWLSGASFLVPVAHAQSVSDLQAQINALLAQITALQAQLAASQGGSTAPATSCSFTRDLTVGAKGADVKCLQQYLNGAGHTLAASGAGSPGSETEFFGSLTKAGLAAWQAANSVAPAVGYFGPISRAKYSSLLASAPPTTGGGTGTTPPAAVGSGLTVTLAPDQPASGLFGESFSSRPFTKLRFTASADGDVTVKGMTVERTGQGNDAAFSGVVGLDEDGVRMGPSKTFGSEHTLRLTEDFVVKAGQTRTVTLAGDSDADQDAYNGQLVSLTLIGVETDGAAVNSAFPLTGNLMTVNSTLAIGSITLARGALDPGSGQTKEIGSTGYIFSGLTLTAGSNEDVTVKSIRWNQSGSAGSDDLANIKVILDGVTYDTTVSSDGKYYTAKFGNGVLIQKGFNKEMYIKGDVVNGSNRTVDFDLHRYADLQVTGMTYGYGLLPSATETSADNDDDGEFQDAQPRYDAFQAHIGTGSISVQNAPTVGSQNIAISLADQPLGGIIVDVKGEDITVASINFDLGVIDSTESNDVDSDDVTNITLVDENGVVVAGPVDGAAGGNNAIQFTDTVTFKPGRVVYTLKGKLNTDLQSNDTVAASTTPSGDWSTVTGVTSGVTLTPSPTSAVTMSTMTVKASSLTVSVAPDTNAGGGNASSTQQTVVAGSSAYEFTKYVLDASGSGEDVRVTSFSLLPTFSSVNTLDDLTNCQLHDGSTALNTGGNVLNPTNSDATGTSKVLTLDTSLIVPKGTVKTLSLKCNLISGAANGEAWQWGIADAAASVVSTGITSGQAVTESITADNGRIIYSTTGGSLTVTLDSASPSLKWAQAGSSDNTLAILSFNAANEDVRVDTLGLQLGADGGNASNSPQDLTKVTVWNGSTKVGEALFTATDYATATLSGVTVPKDGEVMLTIKGDLASIGTGLAGRPGHLVAVNYDAHSSSDESSLGAVGVGVSSGTTIGSGGSDTASNGVRVARAYPTVTKDSSTGTFTNGSSQTLFRFKVSAPSGTLGTSLYKFTFNIATSGVSVTSLDLYCYQSNYSTDDCNTSDGTGRIETKDLTSSPLWDSPGSSNFEFYFDPNNDGTDEAVRVAAGTTKYFAVLGTATGGDTSDGSDSITLKLQGDATYVAGADPLEVVADAGDDWFTGAYEFATTTTVVDGWQDDDFIWAGNSTSSSQSIEAYDWHNGYFVPGLSNSDAGIGQTVTNN